MNRQWLPPVAITGSRLLREELRLCELDAGSEFDFADSVYEGRRKASRRVAIIVGFDLAPRVRTPIRGSGLIVVAALYPDHGRTFACAARIGASCVIGLPGGRRWLAEHLIRMEDL
jgi:hypothetical protein